MSAEPVAVTLRAGNNAITVAMPELYSLTVFVGDATSTARLSLRPAQRGGGWWGTSERVGEDGKVEFPTVPAGEYRLQLQGGPGGMGMMRVSVPRDREVQFTPKPINALEVTVDKPDGYLGQLGFRTGDKVIGIDGTEFADMFQLQAAFAGAMGKEEAVLTVERGGRRLEITINPRRMMGRSDEMGGELEPASR